MEQGGNSKPTNFIVIAFFMTVGKFKCRFVDSVV